jgi:hypothetical protein
MGSRRSSSLSVDSIVDAFDGGACDDNSTQPAVAHPECGAFQGSQAKYSNNRQHHEVFERGACT